MSEIKWTKKELDEFDDLTMQTSSKYQMERINGRMALNRFVEKHGKEKCNAMFEVLMRKAPQTRGIGER